MAATILLGSLVLLIASSMSLDTASEPNNVLEELKHVMAVNSETLQDLITSPSLSFVFFYKKYNGKTIPLLRILERSAPDLELYDVKLAVFDCTNEKNTETTCNKDDKSVFAYRNGITLMSLELDYVFGAKSMIAYALQLLLLHEVPIVQSRLERQELEHSLAGKRDLIFIHPQAVGSSEHSLFLELAHAYEGFFSFALTTDYRTVVGLQDSQDLAAESSLGMWVMFCSEAGADEVIVDGDCPHTMYRGKFTLFDMVTFVQRLLERSVFHAPTDGLASLLNLKADEPIVYVYIKPEDERKENKVLMNILTYDLRGSAKVVFVDMDDSDCQSGAKQQGLTNPDPSMGLRTKDGEIHFLAAQEWSVSSIREFLLPHVFPYWIDFKSSWNEPLDSSNLAENSAGPTHLHELIDEVETQDDEVASAVFSLRQKAMPGLELVPELLKEDFYRAVRRSPLLMVLFYEPFDHLSMAFLRDFGAAAQMLTTNFSTTDVLARVNCFDATDLCAALNVSVYPTVRIYQQNAATPENYIRPLDALSVTKTVKLLQLNGPVLLTTEEEVDQFAKGLYPSDFTKFTPSSVLLLAGDASSEAAAVYKDVCVAMSQTTALAIVHPSLVTQIAQKYATTVAAVVAHNREDKTKPVRTLALDHRGVSEHSISAFIQAATLPIVPELGPENFPHLYALHQPMTVLFVDGSDVAAKESVLATFSTVATSGQFPGSVFCWMDAQVKSLGLKILSEYTWTAQLPMVSVVKHTQGQVYNFQPALDKPIPDDPLETTTLIGWLTLVLSGKAKPSKVLDQGKWGPPGPYYNFLEMPSSQEEEREPTPDGEHQPESQRIFVDYPEDEDSDFIRFKEEQKLEMEVRKMLVELRKQQTLPSDSPVEDGPASDSSVEDEPAPDSLVEDEPASDSPVEDGPAPDSNSGQTHTEL